VKLVDANLLLYAVDEASPHHAVAKPWLERQLSGAETFAFAWAVLLAFVRLATNPRVFADPLTIEEALDLVDSWFEQSSVTVVHPTDRHSSLLRELLAPLGTAGNLTSDAHLAALSIEHGAELCSVDSDFDRFPRVRWTNPLAAQRPGA
jgi:toxin-antitoxin system PIN domain toxin